MERGRNTVRGVGGGGGRGDGDVHEHGGEFGGELFLFYFGEVCHEREGEEVGKKVSIV